MILNHDFNNHKLVLSQLINTENDEVISRLVKKFPNAEICFQDSLPEFNQKIFNCCQIQNIPNVERTELGFHMLPDVQAGMGPIWFTLVHKKIVNNEDM